MKQYYRLKYLEKVFDSKILNQFNCDNHNNENIESLFKNNKVIIFTICDFNKFSTAMERNWIFEQIEILLQILVNKDYKIFILSYEDGDSEVAEKFVYRINSENVKCIKHSNNFDMILDLLNKCYLSINLEESFSLMSMAVEKPFVYLYSNNSNNIETFNNLNLDYLLIKNGLNMNVGSILNKIEHISENIEKIKTDFHKMFEKVDRLNCEEENNKKNEFENYKIKVKETITALVDSNDLKKAKKLISEYESIVKDDVEIYSIKAIVAIMESRLNDAENILNQGLKIDRNYYDLLYNLGYLYQVENKLDLSIDYYKRALVNAKEIEKENAVFDILKSMGVGESVDEIIKSM